MGSGWGWSVGQVDLHPGWDCLEHLDLTGLLLLPKETFFELNHKGIAIMTK